MNDEALLSNIRFEIRIKNTDTSFIANQFITNIRNNLKCNSALKHK